MPVLKQYTPQVKQLYLPSTANLPIEDQAWIKFDTSALSTADVLVVNGDEASGMAATAKMLLGRIEEWNFTEEDGTPVPINYANFCRLDVDDFTYIANQKMDIGTDTLTDAEKKS